MEKLKKVIFIIQSTLVVYRNNAIWFHPVLHIHAEIGPLETAVDQSFKGGSDISLVPTPKPTHF